MKKPPNYIQASLVWGVIVGVIFPYMAWLGLQEMYRLKSVWAIVGTSLLALFFLLIGGFAIYSVFSKRFRYGKVDFEMMVSEDTITIMEKISGKQDAIAWDDVATIAIYSRFADGEDEDGNDVYEHHWCIATKNDKEVTIPFYSTGGDAFAERLKTTPYIDPQKLDAAMNGKKEGFTVIWQK